MFSKLLLVLGIAFANGSNLILKTSQMVYNQAYVDNSTNNDNFYYYGSLFPDWSVNWVSNYNAMQLIATIETSYYAEMPDKVFDYLYFGDFGVEYDFTILLFLSGESILIHSPLNDSFPFVKSSSNVLYDKTLFPEYSFNYSITVNFGYSIQDAFERQSVLNMVLFMKLLLLMNWVLLLIIVIMMLVIDGYDDGADNGYDDGYDRWLLGWL